MRNRIRNPESMNIFYQQFSLATQHEEPVNVYKFHFLAHACYHLSINKSSYLKFLIFRESLITPVARALVRQQARVLRLQTSVTFHMLHGTG